MRSGTDTQHSVNSVRPQYFRTGYFYNLHNIALSVAFHHFWTKRSADYWSMLLWKCPNLDFCTMELAAFNGIVIACSKVISRRWKFSVQWNISRDEYVKLSSWNWIVCFRTKSEDFPVWFILTVSTFQLNLLSNLIFLTVILFKFYQQCTQWVE